MSLWPLDQFIFRPVAMDGASLKFEVKDREAVAITLSHDGHQIELKRM